MDNSRTIYCGNLAKDVTEELLYELFLQAGPVDRVNIPKDKQGVKRNFGFVVFKHDISVPYAVELMSGAKLFGQVLRLQARTNNSESSPEISHHAAARHQKTLSCPPGFSFNHRNNSYGSGNNRHGSRSSNGEDYRSQQHNSPSTDYRSQQAQQQHSSPSTPSNGYNGPIFMNNPIQQQNFALLPVDLPLTLRPESNFILHNQYSYQQNWPVRGNRWMRN